MPKKPITKLLDNSTSLLTDPFSFGKVYWDGLILADYQADILKSIQRNKITVVPAGNKLGKDFIASFAAVHFFNSRIPARVVTTSVDGSQLEGVLWAEMRALNDTAVIPLPMECTHLHWYQKRPDGTRHPVSEMIGRVVAKGEGLLGRHLPHGWSEEHQAMCAPRVLAVVDEASGFDDANYMGIDTWAHRILIIGNPFPCENFFRRMVAEGDKLSDSPYLDYDVKVIQLNAERSPNIQLAREEMKMGLEPSRRIIVPGCMDWDDYVWRRKEYDPIKAAAGLDGVFYEGEEVKMFPPQWLAESTAQAEKLGFPRMAVGDTTIGIDTAEGGDNTVWTACDDLGILEQISMRTRNTAIIKGRTKALMKKWGTDPECVFFDRGGGGKEHVDYMRQEGFDVHCIGFGEAPTSYDLAEGNFGWTAPDERRATKEEKYTYKNRRAQLYGELRNVLNPDLRPQGCFAIPARYEELLRQLKPIPMQYDGEGRIYLPPKDKPMPTYKGITIKQLLGHSPDESDSLALGVFAQVFKPTIHKIGAF